MSTARYLTRTTTNIKVVVTTGTAGLFFLSHVILAIIHGVLQYGRQRNSLAPKITPLLVQDPLGILPPRQLHPQCGEQIGPMQVEGHMHGFGIGERRLGNRHRSWKPAAPAR